MGDIAITLPRDAFLHVEAPREWWWHIGTLQAGKRTFGFEINAAGFQTEGPSSPGTCFSQIMLTDPLNKKHYKRTALYDYDRSWAESDPSRPWFCRVGDLSTRDFVFMQQVGGIGTMDVQASFIDDDLLGTVVQFNLQMSQQGPPLYVWETGIAVNVDPTGLTPLTRNNYYYSLTNLHVSGTVQIGDDKPIPVAGLTWMDHEYGAFGAGTQWVLQDAQLSNGVSFTSSRAGSDFALKEGEPLLTLVTILENGVSKSTPGFATPTKPYPVGETTFYTHWSLVIPAHLAVLEFEALLPDQVFPPSHAGDRPIYEGAATCAGVFDGRTVVGPGWLEQALTAPGPGPAAMLGRGASRASIRAPEPAA